MYGNWACHIYEIWRVSEPPGGEAVKGVILRKGERAYSYFSGVFSAISPAVAERNWLITGYENYPEALEPYGGNLGREAFFWVQGERLEEIVRQQDYPWYWGVLSGFKREVPLHQVLSYGLPYADGYTGFWKNPISIQHPMADIEIVAWARRTSPEHLRYAACYRAASGADNPRYGKKIHRRLRPDRIRSRRHRRSPGRNRIPVQSCIHSAFDRWFPFCDAALALPPYIGEEQEKME